jgi:putative membrane protein
MKCIAAVTALSPFSTWAQGAATEPGWHQSGSLLGAIGLTLLFTMLGVALSIIGYKLFDHFTVGDLHKEIVENKNVAAAIVGAAVILGVSIIVAAAIIG